MLTWAVLCRWKKIPEKKSVPPEKHPLLGEAVLMVGVIGGHPGIQTIWRCIQRLDAETDIFAVFTHPNLSSELESGIIFFSVECG